ncbi:hypothetical protein GUJ93_ZPchr0008g13110 [Zizania palustris]|uniref:Uncharacterized protein n=1 Tax=Zizania palustris TaxID=103762 RepID=A0A8J5VKD1_ZIZPA|nr:hypothetical protein GUJ93_ZPchr0008g13110 [Zizania palustris]
MKPPSLRTLKTPSATPLHHTLVTLTTPASRLAILAKASVERSMVLVHPSLLAQLSSNLTVMLPPVQGLPPPP